MNDMIQEAEQNAKAIVAYWNELIKGGMPENVAAQVISNRLVVTTAINQLESDIEYVKTVVNDRDERFSAMLGKMSDEVAGMQQALDGSIRDLFQAIGVAR